MPAFFICMVSLLVQNFVLPTLAGVVERRPSNQSNGVVRIPVLENFRRRLEGQPLLG